jgi:hypothetical protein
MFQDSLNMISNECMKYHMKVHIVSYNLAPKKIHLLPIYGQTDSKPAIVILQLVSYTWLCAVCGEMQFLLVN